MTRAAAFVRAAALAVGAGAAFGLLEGLWADGLPGESTWARLGSLALLDAVLLGVPLAIGAGAWAALRPAQEPRPGRTLAALGVLLALGASGTWRLGEVLRDLDLDRLQAWHLERPLPVLRASDQARPILLITVDTLRADRVASMPALSRWAATGRQFTQARTGSPWTLPALGTLHSGLPTAAHGAGRRVEGAPLHVRTPLDEVPLLAETLRRQGYVAAAVVTNPYAGARYGFSRGFDRFHDLTHRTLRQRALRRGLLLRGFVPPGGDTAVAVTDRALTLLERGGQGRLFAWVHYLDAHAPYAEAPAGFDPYGPCDLPTCFDDWKAMRAGFFAPGEPERDHVRALYDADVAWLDGQLDRLLDEVAAQGWLEEGLVVLVGDHGEELWDHGGGEHGATFYDEVVRVPLIVWGAGVEAGQDARSIGLADVHRGLRAWAARDGLGPLAPDRPTTPVALSSRLFGDEAAGCVLGQFKRIVEADGTVLWFDLAADPQERVPLGEPPPQARDALIACTPEPLSAADDGVDDAGVLQALGYVD